MNTTTAASEKVMDRVAKLLAIAEHPNTPEAEADVALRQANSLIVKHAIDEAILRQSQSVSERRAIRHSTIFLGGGEFRPYLRTIFEVAAEALRVSVASKYNREERESEFHMYGADEDVAWLDMLFNMIKLQFLTKLDPKWDEALGYDANVYNFKVAGYKWQEIDRLAMSNGHPRRESTENYHWVRQDVSGVEHYGSLEYWQYKIDNGFQLVLKHHKDGRIEVRQYNGFYHSLKGAYVRHAKAIGDDTRVVTQSHQAYRLSFAESFRMTMCERFWKMQRDAEEEMDTIPGAALAIRDMKDEADRAMWADFPEASPEAEAKRREAARAQAEAEAKRREEMLAAMTPKQREAFLEKEEREARRAARAQRAWERKNSYSWDNTARARGAAAANSVDLSRKAGYAGSGATKGELN